MLSESNKQTIAVAGFVVLVFSITAGIIIYNGKNLSQEVDQKKPESPVANREALLATDPTDPLHINNLKYIQGGLEKYYNEKRAYPKTLAELKPLYLRLIPRYSSEKDYLYAYYPAEKPNAYHLGTPLGGRNTISPETLKGDADFNSEKAKYVGGFNGADPVYDIANKK